MRMLYRVHSKELGNLCLYHRKCGPSGDGYIESDEDMPNRLLDVHSSDSKYDISKQVPKLSKKLVFGIKNEVTQW